MNKSKRPRIEKHAVRIVSSLDYKISPGENVPSKSETVPNEAYTIRELIDKARAGVALDLIVSERHSAYASESDQFEDYDAVDPTQSEDFDLVDAQNAAEIIKDVQQKAERNKPKAKEAEESDEESGDSDKTESIEVEKQKQDE